MKSARREGRKERWLLLSSWLHPFGNEPFSFLSKRYLNRNDNASSWALNKWITFDNRLTAIRVCERVCLQEFNFSLSLHRFLFPIAHRLAPRLIVCVNLAPCEAGQFTDRRKRKKERKSTSRSRYLALRGPQLLLLLLPISCSLSPELRNWFQVQKERGKERKTSTGVHRQTARFERKTF